MTHLNSKNWHHPFHLKSLRRHFTARTPQSAGKSMALISIIPPLLPRVALLPLALSSVTLLNGCASSGSVNEKQDSRFAIAQTPVDFPVFKGLLWFPFSWTAQISTAENDPAGRPVSSVQLRNVGLVLRDLQSKEEVFLKLSTMGRDGTSNAALDTTNNSRSFFLPLFVELAEGDYQIETVRFSFVDPNTQRPEQLDLPLTNPFQTTGKPALTIAVKKGKVAALARVVAQTTFGLKASVLNSSTDVENIDNDALSVDMVLEQMHRDAKSSGQVVAASTDFPRSRLALTDVEGKPVPFEEPLARAGLLLDVPCEAEGSLKLVWRRVGDEREYFSLVNLGQRVSDCQGQKTLAPSLSLPKGDWVLRATQISSRTESRTQASSKAPGSGAGAVPLAADSQELKQLGGFTVLKSPTESVKDYYFLQKGMKYNTAGQLEREIQRQIVVRLESMLKPENTTNVAANTRFSPSPSTRGSEVLFLGQFALVPSEGKNGRTEIWETLFKRNYSVDNVKKVFGATEVYNAYTLSKLTRDRNKATVQSVLRVSSSENDAKNIETSTSDFRRNATEMFARCLTEREEFDPLVSVSGVLNFSVLKGGNAVTLKKIGMASEGQSEKWVEECFQKKLLAFRFSKRSPANFQGELKVASE